MADDLGKRGAEERIRISIDEARCWVRRFGATREHLRKAVAEIGASADRIAGYFGKK